MTKMNGFYMCLLRWLLLLLLASHSASGQENCFCRFTTGIWNDCLESYSSGANETCGPIICIHGRCASISPIRCDCETNWIGPVCNRFCNLGCENGGNCRFRASNDDMYCSCPASYSGRLCQYPVCPGGPMFGNLCQYPCRCENDRRCHKETGACVLSSQRRCSPGYFGDNCQTENVALNKNALQSSTYQTFSAGLAVDGNTANSLQDNSCAHTRDHLTAPQNWWMVDLENVQLVNRLRIANSQSNPERLDGFQVYVGNNSNPDSAFQLCYQDQPSGYIPAGVFSFSCLVPLLGRYVKIQTRHSSNILTLCEVEILVCSDYFYGRDCTQNCHCNDPTEVCNKVTGRCSACHQSWQGLACEVCADGKHGAVCNLDCNCRDADEVCDKRDGSCLSGCPDTWEGTACEVSRVTSTFRTTNPTTSTGPTTLIRLINGTYPYEGRVEVYHSRRWGTICDDGWGNIDARVVCRMLGYSGGTAVCCARFGQGSGPIWLDDVGCFGTEADISECNYYNTWGSHNCVHREDAGVRCAAGRVTSTHRSTSTTTSTRRSTLRSTSTTISTRRSTLRSTSPTTSSHPTTPIRLVNGTSPYEGRVEVFHSGEWGTICDDFWRDAGARVVCRMLGYSGGTAVCCARFGSGSGPIWLDNVDCSGTEATIAGCAHLPWGFNNCGHREDAGVRCSVPVTIAPPTTLQPSLWTPAIWTVSSAFSHVPVILHGIAPLIAFPAFTIVLYRHI